jgi:hypothetical protein
LLVQLQCAVTVEISHFSYLSVLLLRGTLYWSGSQQNIGYRKKSPCTSYIIFILEMVVQVVVRWVGTSASGVVCSSVHPNCTPTPRPQHGS